jgi:hypothetical protein
MYDAIKDGSAHFFLYAKEHYQKGDVLDDLKNIMAHRQHQKPEQVCIGNIVIVLVQIVQKLTAGDPCFLQQFILRIREDLVVWPNHFPAFKQPTFDEVLINACLGELATAIVQEGKTIYIRLGNPDPSILPLRQATNISNPQLQQEGNFHAERRWCT